MIDELREILEQMRAARSYPEKLRLTQKFINEGMNSGGDDRGSIAIMFNAELEKMVRDIQSNEQE